MITGSGRWIPPSLPPTRSPELEKDSATTYAAGRSRRVELERTLTEPQRDEFEDVLRSLTLERSQIKYAMGFALDNADAAGEVVEVLTEALTLQETPIPTKVARLMLVSDILHNSSAPVKNASAYRTKFEATLPDIIESFNHLYGSITGRITAEALKERVLKVLQVWADWFLFSDAYVNGLRATFLRSGNSGVTPFHSLCGDAPEIGNESSSEDLPEVNRINQDVALAMGKGAAMEELLGLPLTELERRCRHNGLSLVGGREMMVERLLNLEEAEKQRGFDREEDVEYAQSNMGRMSSRDDDRREFSHGSEPGSSTKWNRHGMEGKGSSASLPQTFAVPQPEMFAIPQPEIRGYSNKKGKSDPILAASKWSREDDGSDDDDDDRKGDRGLGLTYSSSGSENAGDGLEKADEAEMSTDVTSLSQLESSMCEEHRQKLRHLEVAVMEYREALEEWGIPNPEEIKRKVANQRRRLQSELGLLDSSEGSSKQSSRRASSERKGRRDDAHDSSRKRLRSQSQRSPQKRERHHEKDRLHDGENDRGRHREKSGSRESDDHERDRTRERGGDRRRKGK